MSSIPVSAGLALFFSLLFAALYSLLSTFAQALESLSTIRRRSLLEESPSRFGQLLAPENVQVSRIAVRLTTQGAVLGGLVSLGTVVASFGVPEAWFVAPAAVLLGWLVLEGSVLRWVATRGPEHILRDFAWLIPVVLLFAAPLYPLLSRIVDSEGEGNEPVTTAAEKEAAKEADMRALLDVAREEGILEKHEEELVSRAVDFGDRTVREVMTPRPDMVFGEADQPFAQIADLFERTKHTRIPLVEGSVEKPIGFVHIKDVFAALRAASPPATARGLARPIFFAPESQTINTLLADFRRRRQHLAIVVDEYGAVVGLATLDDLVEELVGEIADEHENAIDPVVPLADGTYSVAGRVRVTEIGHLFDVELEQAEYDTVAGLVSARLGTIPKPGEAVEEAGIRFLVEEADRRRVYRLKVERVAVPA